MKTLYSLSRIPALLASGMLLFGSGIIDSARAQASIGWNYVGVGGVALTTNDIAGAPGFAQDDWNNHSGVGQGPGTVPLTDLFDDTGTVTTADVTGWSLVTNNSWQHNQTGSPDEILMNDFNNTQPTITFSEIPYTTNGYTVVVYYGNNEGPSTSTLSVGNQSRPIKTGNTAGSSFGTVGYVEGTDTNFADTTSSNYSVFVGLSDSTLEVSLSGLNNNGISAIQLVEELATDPPAPPSGPDPANAAVDVPIDKTLNWNDSIRADEYDIFLWVATDPEPGTPTATVGVSEYDPPGDLVDDEDYNWRVVARNTGSAATTNGPTWSFITAPILPPDPFFLVSPLDAATGVSPTAILDWEDAGLATSYEVYLWIPPDPQPGAPTAVTTASQYDPPGDLAAGTTYNWTVDAVNSTGTTSTLDGTWSFTIQSPPVGPPTNPNPADTATGVSPVTGLDWDDVANATSYNVRLWFSTDPRPNDPDAVVTASFYQPPSTLFSFEDYTWEVEAVNSAGMTTGGPWTFSTDDSIAGDRRIGWNMQGVGGTGLGVFDVAGAPGFAQAQWNNHASTGQAPGTVPLNDLFDDTGTSTTADVVGWTQSVNNSWQHNQTANPDEILMNDFANKEAAITFAQIPYGSYTVVVYYGNNEGPNTSTLTVGSQVRTITTGNTAQSSHRNVGYVEGTDANTGDPTNYSVFTGLSGSGLTVSLTTDNNNGISGIQIVDGGDAPAPIVVTDISLAGTTATLTFEGEAGVTTWLVKASTDLLSFPIDETPTATITEGPAGVYSADVDITGDPTTYFLRIEK